jgi:hypothetical protein
MLSSSDAIAGITVLRGILTSISEEKNSDSLSSERILLFLSLESEIYFVQNFIALIELRQSILQDNGREDSSNY